LTERIERDGGKLLPGSGFSVRPTTLEEHQGPVGKESEDEADAKHASFVS